MRKIFLSVSKILLALTLISNAYAEAVGKVSFAHGLVTQVAINGDQAIIGKGGLVHTGDSITTIDKAFVLIRFVDGTQIALRSSSKLRINAYTFVEDDPSKDNAEFELLSGGMRGVSGKIGKRNNAKDYRVKSRGSFIGIRGTDYFAARCDSSEQCEDLLAPNYVPGLYAAVEDGEIVLSNNANSTNILKGQAGYSGASNATLLAITPPGLKFTLPGDGEACLVADAGLTPYIVATTH